MEILSLSWRSSLDSEDVHLMRGSSPPLMLRERLRVSWRSAPGSPAEHGSLDDFLAAHPDAECTFKPTFKHTLDPSTNEHQGFGVRVNARTGEVIAAPHTGPDVLFNFIVLVVVVGNRNDPASPRMRAYQRIHVHNFVARAWLTPTELRVPRRVGGHTFAIFAQFDDQTIGRIPSSGVIDWFSNPPDVVDNNSGIINIRAQDPDDVLVDVQAVLTVEFRDEQGQTVTALGAIQPYTLPQVARLLPGSAGFDRLSQVPNFIFLADGFQVPDQARFNAMIDLFMRDLRQNEKFKPFDLLLGSMNFWKVFVPSAARGIGTKSEVYGDGRARPVSEMNWEFKLENDAPVSESDLVTGTWGPNQILLYFGMPVLIHKGMSNDAIRAYWKKISYLPESLIDTAPGDLIGDWKKEGDRRLVNESDTFLGTYYGGPTRAQALPFEDRRLKYAKFEMNEQRLPRSRLNSFLRSLQYRDENGGLHPIGQVWDLFSDTGKDSGNVIVILCANSGRERNIGGQLFCNAITKERDYVGIEADPAVNTGFAGGRAVRMSNLDGARIPADLPLIPGKTMMLHEIAHSLGLGDEYGEPRISAEDPRLVYTGTGGLGIDGMFSNVQLKSDLLITPGEADLNVAKIKWRWHRIERAGVLAPAAPPDPRAITPDGARFRIRLRQGHAGVFKDGDIVILRRRRAGQPILPDIEYPFVGPPRYPFVTRSPEFSVTHVDAVAGEVTVEPVDAAAIAGRDLREDFQAECVLYVPQPARYFYPPTGENLEMIAANVLEFMAGTRRPVHERLDSQGRPLPDDGADQNPDFTDPALAAIEGISGCAKKNRDIVALYAGGMTYHHGVYHATGHCVMRDSTEIAEFCSVCKYGLTDFIDPTLHPQVDKSYEKYYPLKRP